MIAQHNSWTLQGRYSFDRQGDVGDAESTNTLWHAEGVEGGALRFKTNVRSKFIPVPAFLTLPGANSHNAFTSVSGWFRTYDNWAIELFEHSNGVDYFGVKLEGGKLTFRFTLWRGGPKVSTTKSYNDGRWHHFVISREGNWTAALYVNGELIQRETSTGEGNNLNAELEIIVGKYLNGDMDEIDHMGSPTH